MAATFSAMRWALDFLFAAASASAFAFFSAATLAFSRSTSESSAADQESRTWDVLVIVFMLVLRPSYCEESWSVVRVGWVESVHGETDIVVLLLIVELAAAGWERRLGDWRLVVGALALLVVCKRGVSQVCLMMRGFLAQAASELAGCRSENMVLLRSRVEPYLARACSVIPM